MRSTVDRQGWPATYGEIMKPLDMSLLPSDLAALCQTDSLVREWIHLADSVRRAEKVSCWKDWTPEQRAAYDANDFRLFSRLRGYTEGEIAQFDRYLELVATLDARHGEGFCCDADFCLAQLVETPESRAVDREIGRVANEERD